VLVSTREHVDFRNSGQFNHVITIVELAENEQYAFLDASCADCDFAVLPPLCQVDEGLLVNYDSSRVVHVVQR